MLLAALSNTTFVPYIGLGKKEGSDALHSELQQRILVDIYKYPSTHIP